MGKHDAALAAVGLCRKAGKLILGTDEVCLALRGAKKPFGVLAANDISENTAKRLRDKCATYGVPLCRLEADCQTLAHAIGKKTKVAAVAVTDQGLWGLVESRLTKEN